MGEERGLRRMVVVVLQELAEQVQAERGRVGAREAEAAAKEAELKANKDALQKANTELEVSKHARMRSRSRFDGVVALVVCVWWQCVRESLVDKEALVEDLLQDKARLEGKVATLGGQLAAEKTEAKTAQVSSTTTSSSRSTRSLMGWAAGGGGGGLMARSGGVRRLVVCAAAS